MTQINRGWAYYQQKPRPNIIDFSNEEISMNLERREMAIMDLQDMRMEQFYEEGNY